MGEIMDDRNIKQENILIRMGKKLDELISGKTQLGILISSILVLGTWIFNNLNPIDVISVWNKIELDEFIAKDIMEDYENAYYYALQTLFDENYYDKSNPKSEKEKEKIKDKSMEKFKKILVGDVYNEVEKHIFIDNEYSDIDNYEYKFNFTHTENNEFTLKVENDTMEFKGAYFYKINRQTGEKSKNFKVDDRKYKVKRKSWTINKYILFDRIDL